MCPFGESYNWREICDSCDNQAAVFDTTISFFALSFICAVLLTLGFVVRCCGWGGKDRTVLHAIIGCIGLLCLVIGVAVFATRLPKATADDWAKMTPPRPCVDPSPCTSFVGTKPIPGTGDQGHEFWVPGGWIAGVVAIPFYLYVICCAFSRTIDSDKPLLGNQYQTGQAYQPLTTAGGTYVPPQMPTAPHNA
jgi:hypothetical protein